MSKSLQTVLIADDEPDICEMLSDWIEGENWRAVQVNDGESALSELRRGTIDVALIDLMMPGLDGLQLLSRMLAENIRTDVVMISGYGTIPIAIQAIKSAWYCFIALPVNAP